MKPLDRLKARAGSLSPAALAKVREACPTAARLIEEDLPRLIRVAELASSIKHAQRPSYELNEALRELDQ